MPDSAVATEAAAPPATVPEIVMVEVQSVKPSPKNRKCTEDDPAIFDMAESIDAVGLINPITVRPVLDGGYEIVSGERRWLAHRLLNRTAIPCIVQDLSDDQAQALRITENLHRQNLSPLEEGDSIAQLLEILEREMPGKNIHKEAARRLGYEEGWVRHRAKLPNLIQAWRDEIALPGTRYSRFRRSVGHLEAIAMLPAASQEQLLSSHTLSTCSTVEDVRTAIARWAMNLDFKPWSRDYEKSISSCKRCDSCSKRSDKERTLFSEIHEVVDVDKAKVRLCLDRECWQGKLEGWCKYLMNEDASVLPLWDGYPTPVDEKNIQAALGVRLLAGYKWAEKSGLGCPRQARGIFLGGGRAGTTVDVWVREEKSDEEYDENVIRRREEMRREQEEEQAKASALQEKISSLIPEDVSVLKRDGNFTDYDLAAILLNCAVWFGVGMGDEIDVLDISPGSCPGIRHAWGQIREEIVRVISEILYGDSPHRNDAAIVEHFCERLSVDFDALKEEAEA